MYHFVIPYGIEREAELLRGFSARELKLLLLFSAGSVLISLLLYALLRDVSIAIVLLLTFLSASYLLTKKGVFRQSIVDDAIDFFRAQSAQRIYPYRYEDEWRTSAQEA